MSEKPLERLNYYNGQRLEAKDLKLEQEYHIRVRRWLNKSLYSSGGIAQGLTVRVEKVKEDKAEKPVIIVSPGLAIDTQGREIVLVKEKSLDLPGETDTYLTIEYGEQMTEEETGSCTVRSKHHSKTGDKVTWGGPARILAQPLLNFYSGLPPDGSGKIVLAKVTQINNCQDVEFDMSLRRYIGASSASKVNQYALEGERHIDKNNPGRIYFHIRGRQPNAVTLYLRAERFSTLYYTELGRHEHDIAVSVSSMTIPEHNHSVTATIGNDGAHTPTVNDVRAQSTEVLVGSVQHGFNIDARGDLKDQDIKKWTNMVITMDSVGGHSHAINISMSPDPQKAIPLSGTGSSSTAGVTDPDPGTALYSARSGNPLTYINTLKIGIRKPGKKDFDDLTKDILEQLKANRPSDQDWRRLGNGGSAGAGDPLVDPGTGPIKLDFLPELSFDEVDGGEYVIELSVDKDNDSGGRILYNLYVE